MGVFPMVLVPTFAVGRAQLLTGLLAWMFRTKKVKPFPIFLDSPMAIEATRIYAEAYGRDPELYQFLKTMETYRRTMAADTTLILSTDGEFFRFLKQSR